MTLLHEAVDAKKFDSRVVERNIQRGLVREDDYRKSVNTLPDDAVNAEWISIESIAGDDSASN